MASLCWSSQWPCRLILRTEPLFCLADTIYLVEKNVNQRVASFKPVEDAVITFIHHTVSICLIMVATHAAGACFLL